MGETQENPFELDATRYPILSQLGLPISKTLLSALLCEIVLLSRNHPDKGILTYSTHRGTEGTLLNIPRSRNEDSFGTIARSKNSWIKQLPTLVTADGDAAKGADWILHQLGLDYGDEFVSRVQKMRFPILLKKPHNSRETP